MFHGKCAVNRDSAIAWREAIDREGTAYRCEYQRKPLVS